MAAPTSFMSETYIDYGGTEHPGEKSNITLAVPNLTAGNLVATTALVDALVSAFQGIILGNHARHEVVQDRTYPTPAASTNKLAQRENKWLLRYHDVSGNKFSAELPTADLSKLSATGTEFLNATDLATLKAAFDAVVKDPNNGGATFLDSVQFVGRRL